MMRAGSGAGTTNVDAARVNAARIDVDWLAWQYLLNELDAEAAAAFEGRLAEDEAAAVALAHAARLQQAMACCRESAGCQAAGGGDGRGDAAAGNAGARHGASPSRAAPGDRAGHPVWAVRGNRGIAVVLAAVAAALLVVVVGGQSVLTTGRSRQAADLVRLWAAAAPDLAVSEEAIVEEAGAGVDEVPDWLRTAVALDSERRAAEAARGMDPAVDENDVL